MFFFRVINFSWSGNTNEKFLTVNSMIALVPRLSDAGTYVDATKLSTMEYMSVRSTNKRAAFMGTTFTRISGEHLLVKVRASCCCWWWLFEPRGLLPLSSVTVLIKTERT